MRPRAPVRAGRRITGALCAIILVVVLTGCQVATTVAVRVQTDGRGTVTVDVDFDGGAVRAVGGVDGALHVADLVAAGWKVTSDPSAGGATVVTFSHGFFRTSDVPVLLAEIGRSPTGAHAPLFALRVAQTRSAAGTRTAAVGRVDLSCGLACFGDAGLQRVYGHELGVDPANLRTASGRSAVEQMLPFSFDLEVPGHVTASDADPRRSRSGLRWAPVLGGRTQLSATATAVDPTRVREATAPAGRTGSGGVAGVALVAGLVAGLAAALGLRHRRAQRRHP